MQDLVVGKGGGGSLEGYAGHQDRKQHGGVRLDEATRQQVQLALRWRKCLAATAQSHQGEREK